ncbi:MAG: peptide deformylase [Candidatus Wildermuthbacteria bacterium RIFCSPHIGHO2_02_FULL_47_12]|uniref:Peptide deformylase n=1 Tax=Candidatus Wildermuthbacteria bacterium RIFCSPHIGHO2_02_FULL_47_12 TaxID=1802451 RepID=A0A1G2R166_9BACT|nr:MAG: peptide deformylase [Candidatus Wildermuthbacteria bacterium RIFCSPHIGHO2_02_FULL_47_12]
MLKIVKYPSPILKKKSEEVSRNDQTLRSLAPQMVETMRKNQGIGLAAPQIGISKKIIVVTEGKEAHVFLNPRIVKQSKEKEQDEEGCLSLPGLFVKILRSKQVEVVAETLDGEEIRLVAQGLGARIFQHEIDHIEGKLIINRVSPLLRWKLRHQLKNLGK